MLSSTFNILIQKNLYNLIKRDYEMERLRFTECVIHMRKNVHVYRIKKKRERDSINLKIKKISLF